jgi:hypothetical protein
MEKKIAFKMQISVFAFSQIFCYLVHFLTIVFKNPPIFSKKVNLILIVRGHKHRDFHQ